MDELTLVDEPFEALVSLGRRAIRDQTWFFTEQLRRKLRRDARTVPDVQTPNWLRELPQPYVERGLPELSSDAAEAHAITVISGPAGCGKTTLAVRLAHRLAHRFPDGQLMVDMRGFAAEAPMSTNEAVDLLLHQMGMFGSNGNESPEARRLRLVRALENGRFIVVLDNVADSPAVRPLLPRGDSSRTIIASRRTLATVAMKHGAGSLELGLLTTTEAEELFAALIGRERMDAEPEAAARLLAACGNLPLAVSIAGRQIALLPGQALEQIASALTESESRLDFLDLGEPEASIRSILSWSYMSLGPDQRRTYLLVGTAPGPDLDVPAAISLLGSEQARGRYERSGNWGWPRRTPMAVSPCTTFSVTSQRHWPEPGMCRRRLCTWRMVVYSTTTPAWHRVRPGSPTISTGYSRRHNTMWTVDTKPPCER
ncbi:NB-ARC domain-containing protein [Actinomadura yumaensis]|uniref:NB-ARC domain-containing protein n=1 Tax=Actinomadura yumaensis TaxID=111807 RepID=UPI00362173E4